MDADWSAHVLTKNSREPIVETRKDASGSDLVRIGVEVGPAMGHPRCRRAGHGHFGNIGRPQHSFDGACNRRAYDAVSTWIFRMHRRVVDRLPGRLAFRGVVAVNIAVTNGSDWAPERVLVLGINYSDTRVGFLSRS